MKTEYFKNEDTINIFSDASIEKLGKNKYRGCYGAAVVLMDQEIDSAYHVCADTTSNNSEIKGIRLAVSLALKYRSKFPYINIISDSQISIFGIRDRIFQWKNVNGTLCGYSNTPIINQSVFIEIMRLIVDNKLKINFWHQKGHVSLNSNASLDNALHVFQSSNGIRDQVPMSLIKYLSYWNDVVDNKSRNILKDADKNKRYIDPLVFYPDNFHENIFTYEDLIYSPYYSMQYNEY